MSRESCWMTSLSTSRNQERKWQPSRSISSVNCVVGLWTWDAEKVRNIGESLRQLEALAPSCGKVLGCYMWDYGRKRPMPLDVLRDLYGLGLDWLRQGRIEGMIFLASCICDLQLEAVEWTREWIAKIGDESI